MHRGPDDAGLFKTDGRALGNQRLSIIGLEDGHQPFVSDDGQIVVVQNGEIFNHIELARELAAAGNPCRTHCDTEVLLRLYETEGMRFISKLNGMFAIAIYDARKDTLFLARDRAGVKPLYLYNDGTRIVFGSEIKAVLPAIDRPRLSLEAIDHYLTFNYIPPPYTAYADITHVGPGRLVTITDRGLTDTTWWSLTNIDHDLQQTEQEWIDQFNEILADAVDIRMRADVPFGAFLSGGVDSSTIVALMSKNSPNPVKTYCIGFDDQRYDESAWAQLAAGRFGAQHRAQIVKSNLLDLWPLAIEHCDQPHGDISFLPTYKVSELAAADVKMVLTGDGGDELFGGYDKYVSFFANQMAYSDDLDCKRYFDSISLLSAERKSRLYSSKTRAALKGHQSWDVAARIFSEVKNFDSINAALYLDFRLLLPGNNLVKPDRMGMAVSLEARTPFLDYRMIELAFRMPGHMKIRQGTSKYIYKKAVQNLIGPDLAYRKKQMFTVPVGEWFRSDMRSYCEANFSELAVTSLFDGRELHTILDDHTNGRANNTREIRALIALNLFLKSESAPLQS